MLHNGNAQNNLLKKWKFIIPKRVSLDSLSEDDFL